MPAHRAALRHPVAGKRLDFVVQSLGDKPYLTGDRFTIADAYLFTIVTWHEFLEFDISRWPTLERFQARVAGRPQVQAALRAEHLLKDAEPAAAAATA